MRATLGGRAAVRRLLDGCPAGPPRRSFVGAPLAAGAPHRAAPGSGQVRHAGRRRKSIVEEEGVEVLPRGSEAGAPRRGDDEEAESGGALPEVPAEILDAWEKDEMAQEALGMFSSEELQGKGVMSYRDVARMLELMGCDRLTFLRMLNDEGDDEGDEDSDGEGGGVKGKGGKGKGGKGKGDLFDDDEPWAARGGGGKKGLKGGSDDRLDFDDSDDEVGFGKGGGKKGKKGSKGRFDDSDDEGFGYGGGKKGKKGSKGKFDDFDDEGFGYGGGKGKGGKGGFKGGGKGKGKGKGGYDF